MKVDPSIVYDPCHKTKMLETFNTINLLYKVFNLHNEPIAEIARLV